MLSRVRREEARDVAKNHTEKGNLSPCSPYYGPATRYPGHEVGQKRADKRSEGAPESRRPPWRPLRLRENGYRATLRLRENGYRACLS